MDILFIVIISGMAVSYITELLSNVVGEYFSPRIIKLVLTLPLSFLSVWFLNLSGFEVVVGGFAAAFFSLAVLQLLNRPVTIANVSNRR